MTGRGDYKNKILVNGGKTEQCPKIGTYIRLAVINLLYKFSNYKAGQRIFLQDMKVQIAVTLNAILVTTGKYILVNIIDWFM
jgi:transglutaminase/protease-like cytokinesis protein 3